MPLFVNSFYGNGGTKFPDKIQAVGKLAGSYEYTNTTGGNVLDGAISRAARAQDRARIVSDCRTANDPGMISSAISAHRLIPGSRSDTIRSLMPDADEITVFVRVSRDAGMDSFLSDELDATNYSVDDLKKLNPMNAFEVPDDNAK